MRKVKFRVMTWYWDEFHLRYERIILHQCDSYEIAEHFAKTSDEPLDLQIEKVFIFDEENLNAPKD